MEKAIHQYEEFFLVTQESIPDEMNEQIRKDITDFKAAHDHYYHLVDQLEICIRNYKSLHNSLQKRMFPYIRKMKAEIRQQK
ncbi:hypothetical protein [Flavobacterium sp.]|uniref:hypothetical protein n=1 Tax=Flavobacterium sp. TaxID=239 RepID=UPI003C39AD51